MKVRALLLMVFACVSCYVVIAQEVRPERTPAGADAPMDMQRHMEMMNNMMVKALGESDENYDARFIDMMIPHHEGAVLMAKDAVKKAKHQELKDMAAKMIKDQEKEIKQLKQLKEHWYGEKK